MKERPILFSAPMVKAILEGRKTQTRRVMKVQPTAHPSPPCNPQYNIDLNPFVWCAESGAPAGLLELCPFGKVGDELWVRETFMPRLDLDENDSPERRRHYTYYKASSPNAAKDDGHWHPYPMKWTPSIFMPRWASRIQLRITAVRVERLQDISEADAWAEGAPTDGKSSVPVEINAAGFGGGWNSARSWFESIWSSINGAESWAANPFVWVVEFERVKP